MTRTYIAIFGLKASGKTYFSDYLHNKYYAKVLYLSRMLEAKLCTNTTEGFAKYSDLKLRNHSRIPLIKTLENEIIKDIKEGDLIVIEGFLSNEDCEYFNKYFNVDCIKVVISNDDYEKRFQRFCDRHHYEKNIARTELLKDDSFRNQAGYNKVKESCNYFIENNKTKEAFENEIDKFMRMIGV